MYMPLSVSRSLSQCCLGMNPATCPMLALTLPNHLWFPTDSAGVLQCMTLICMSEDNFAKAVWQKVLFCLWKLVALHTAVFSSRGSGFKIFLRVCLWSCICRLEINFLLLLAPDSFADWRLRWRHIKGKICNSSFHPFCILVRKMTFN